MQRLRYALQTLLEALEQEARAPRLAPVVKPPVTAGTPTPTVVVPPTLPVFPIGPGPGGIPPPPAGGPPALGKAGAKPLKKLPVSDPASADAKPAAQRPAPSNRGPPGGLAEAAARRALERQQRQAAKPPAPSASGEPASSAEAPGERPASPLAEAASILAKAKAQRAIATLLGRKPVAGSFVAVVMAVDISIAGKPLDFAALVKPFAHGFSVVSVNALGPDGTGLATEAIIAGCAGAAMIYVVVRCDHEQATGMSPAARHVLLNVPRMAAYFGDDAVRTLFFCPEPSTKDPAHPHYHVSTRDRFYISSDVLDPAHDPDNAYDAVQKRGFDDFTESINGDLFALGHLPPSLFPRVTVEDIAETAATKKIRADISELLQAWRILEVGTGRNSAAEVLIVVAADAAEYIAYKKSARTLRRDGTPMRYVPVVLQGWDTLEPNKLLSAQLGDLDERMRFNVLRAAFDAAMTLEYDHNAHVLLSDTAGQIKPSLSWLDSARGTTMEFHVDSGMEHATKASANGLQLICYTDVAPGSATAERLSFPFPRPPSTSFLRIALSVVPVSAAKSVYELSVGDPVDVALKNGAATSTLPEVPRIVLRVDSSKLNGKASWLPLMLNSLAALMRQLCCPEYTRLLTGGSGRT